ncbi:MAG: SEC-C metal-binding domain-containing protein [Desulfovibrionales bacterium]|nr:SEC-C metal-binding domain-containing protein [Desulfovibrionales bacterium]
MHPSLEAEFIPPRPLEPKIIMGRNEPCWCGSRKKWKKCHKDRHLQPEIPIGKLIHDMFEDQKNGICLHPEASPMNCSNQLIRAHTVQRSGGLSAIAENGYVISGKRGYERIFKNDGQIVPESVGIGRASTFMGFCSIHDNKLFEPIENSSFTLNNETAFLLSFRAISYEYLTKQNAMKAVDIQREMDRGKDFETQVTIQQYCHAYRAGLIRGMQNLQEWKAEYDRKFLARDFLSMPHYALEFNGILPFVCCGGFHPEVDFFGRQLQVISRSDAPMEHVCLNISVFGARSFLAFGWFGILDGPSESFVKSFKSIPNTDKANSSLILAVEQLENTYFSPSWWNLLNKSDKEYLVKRMQSGVGPNSLRPADTYRNIRQVVQSVPVTAEIGTV